jgi:hypothetical protein
MAKCKVCDREMLTAKGCAASTVFCNGKEYKRIPSGDEQDLMQLEEGRRCHDCGATTGHYHHWGCDAERCPACGIQLIICDCEDVKLIY